MKERKQREQIFWEPNSQEEILRVSGICCETALFWSKWKEGERKTEQERRREPRVDREREKSEWPVWVKKRKRSICNKSKRDIERKRKSFKIIKDEKKVEKESNVARTRAQKIQLLKKERNELMKSEKKNPYFCIIFRWNIHIPADTMIITMHLKMHTPLLHCKDVRLHRFPLFVCSNF